MGAVGRWGVAESCYDVEGDEMGVYNAINCNTNDGRQLLFWRWLPVTLESLAMSCRADGNVRT